MKKHFLFPLLFFVQTVFGQNHIDSVFTENFDNNQNCWDLFSNATAVAQINNGKFFMATSGVEPEYLFLHPFWVRWSTDFKLEAKIVHDPAGPGRFGMAWGMRKRDSYCMMTLNKKGVLSISLVNDKKEKIISQKTIAGIPGPEYVFTVERVNEHLDFLLNGQKQFSASVNKLPPYGDGFAFYMEGQDKVQADQLTIKGKFQRMKLVPDAVKGVKKENLGTGVNSDHEDICPLISADGNTLYYIRADHPENIKGAARDDIWLSTRKADGQWEKGKNIGAPLNTADYNTITSVSVDNNSIYLAQVYNADGTIKGNGLSVSNRTTTGWSMPKEVVIKNFYNVAPYVMYHMSPDKLFLIQAIEGKNSKGKSDLYISFLQADGTYSEPLNMGPVINTGENETTPFMAADNHTLYFSSNGHPGYGSNDIFVSHRLDDTWQNWSVPQNLGPEINTCKWDAYFTIPASGEYAYMTTVMPVNNKSDIVRIKLTKASKPKPVVLVKGRVLDQKTGKPVSGVVVYNEISDARSVARLDVNPSTGEYSIVLQFGKKYSFRAEAENYYSVNDFVDVTDLKEYKEINKDLYVVPIEVGQVVRLNNVFFDFDKASLKPESAEELDRLVSFMQKNTAVSIEIAGHTDDRGEDLYNTKLSQRRTESVMDYLVQKGIGKTRLQAKGYGEKKPVVANDTEEHRAQNRRVEFVILER